MQAYHTLGSHQVKTPLNNVLVKLHTLVNRAVRLPSKRESQKSNILGDSIHEETTHTIVAVVDSDQMSGLVQLVRACQSSRARTDDRHLLSSTAIWWVWSHPAHLKALCNV